MNLFIARIRSSRGSSFTPDSVRYEEYSLLSFLFLKCKRHSIHIFHSKAEAELKRHYRWRPFWYYVRIWTRLGIDIRLVMIEDPSLLYTRTSTVMDPMMALWWPSNVSNATCWIWSSVLPKNCSHAANNISSFWPWILTYKYIKRCYRRPRLVVSFRQRDKLHFSSHRPQRSLYRCSITVVVRIRRVWVSECVCVSSLRVNHHPDVGDDDTERKRKKEMKNEKCTASSNVKYQLLQIFSILYNDNCDVIAIKIKSIFKRRAVRYSRYRYNATDNKEYR